MGYDEVIPLLGDFGKYQRRVYILLCLPAIVCAFHKLGNVFLNAIPHYRCKIPGELDNASYFVNDTQLPFVWDNKENEYLKCELNINNKTEPCDKFIFDHELYGYTTVIEFELTCSKTYLVATADALFMVGVMLGSIIFGELSDRYGRKLIFFIALVIQLVSGIAAAFAPEFWTYAFARVIVGSTTSGVFLVAFVIALEMVGTKWRPVAGIVLHMFFSIGYMLIVVFAMYIYNWRYLQFALTISGVVFLCYWWFIPESARWLLTKNRIDDAKAVIVKAAKINNVEIASDKLHSLLVPLNETNEPEQPPTNHNVFHIFKYPNLRKKALIIFYDWFANNLSYYGLSWNTNNLAGNPYLNFVLAGAVEIPAFIFLILFLNKWGRRNIMCGCMVLSGISLLLTMAIPKEKQWLIVTLAMIGKLAITASYGVVYVFSSEQFPTVIRNAGLGAGSTCARVGAIIAPYINIMATIWQPLPLLIFGCIALIGGTISLVLPETLNKKLPETMEEGERFGKKINTKKNSALKKQKYDSINAGESISMLQQNANA